MSDETNTLVQEPALPTIETQANETEIIDEGPVSIPNPGEVDEDEAPEQSAEADQEEQAAPAFVDIEINGKTYQVPAELKDGYMMQSAFTQKTQAIAEEKRALEARFAEVDQLRSASDEELQVRAQALNLDAQLQQYQNVDWQALLRDDPIGAQEHRWNFEALQQQRQQVGQYLQTAEQQRSASVQQETVKRLQETRAYAEKEIKGWTPEVDEKVTSFAMDVLGFPRETLLNASSPPVYKALYLAWRGHLSEMNQNAKITPQAARPPLKPLSTVSAKTNVLGSKDPADMSMAEYDAWASKKFKR